MKLMASLFALALLALPASACDYGCAVQVQAVYAQPVAVQAVYAQPVVVQQVAVKRVVAVQSAAVVYGPSVTVEQRGLFGRRVRVRVR